KREARVGAGEEPTQITHRLDERERRVRHSVNAQQLLGARLVEAEGEAERIAARVRKAEELADRGHVGFAIWPVKTFGDVEDDVGSFGAKALGKGFVGLETDHLARGGERGGDGVDRLGGVPLRVDVADTGRLLV